MTTPISTPACQSIQTTLASQVPSPIPAPNGLNPTSTSNAPIPSPLQLANFLRYQDQLAGLAAARAPALPEMERVLLSTSRVFIGNLR